MDLFYAALLPVLALAVLGLAFRAARAMRSRLDGVTGLKERLSALPGIAATLLSPKGWFDILTLRRSFGGGPWRWITAALIHAGFVGLLVVHAFGPWTANLFDLYYEATLDPFYFLRDVFGFMLCLGLLMVIWRRLFMPRLRRITRPMDWALLIVVAGIGLSGVFWQAAKSVSPAAFERMTDEYFYGGEEELAALKAVWTVDYDVVFPRRPDTSPETLELGRELNADSCSSCHAPASSAFMSSAVAKALSPAAPALERVDAAAALGTLHGLFILAGILLLPIGKFAHVVTTPLNLLRRRGRSGSEADRKRAAGEMEAARQEGLAACTHCGECSLRCSVAPAYDVLGIRPVLPSEKLADLGAYASGRLTGKRLDDFGSGSRICSQCGRCTDVCPSGIDLQDLWLSSLERLKEEKLAGPQYYMPGKSPSQRMTALRGLAESKAERARSEKLVARKESYLGCVQCTTCTSVCTVVNASANPARELDFTPQQVMNLLRMGLVDHALGAGMTWNCVTCYKCQEHCPQGVPVADVLFELRNIANARLREGED